MDELVRKVSRRLGTDPKETVDMIAEALGDPCYQERLVEILGYEMMDEIETICRSQEYFVSQEKAVDKGFYVEYNFPESIPAEVDGSEIVSTDATGEDKKYFDYERFNKVQSKVFKAAYRSDGNMLVCAPTSSGKTDVALLCVLRALGKGSKVVYIVPMRALATEIAFKYRRKLGEQRVVEYTGDTEMKVEEMIRYDVIVSTPEKFDVVTRKQYNVFRGRIGLVVLDEIHMLQDERGPVVEAIVCRMFRYVELWQKHIRIVGLSATLPNHSDVGMFLKAEHVFSFDGGYRPVPLRMSVVGMTRRSKPQLEEDFLRRKVKEYLNDGKQVLVFVHSRAETTRTAKLLSDEDVRREVKGGIVSGVLLELVRREVGIHHAGLPRRIRLYMEDEFKMKRIKVLVTTATLAWGVNLPAYAVIIKGTRFYDSSKGRFSDLGILDVLQIFGRAGRPQFDARGEGCLITTGDKMDHYVSLLKNSRDVESRLLQHVADVMNAEIYLGTIEDVSTAMVWLKNTFMYIRMSKNPMQYGVSMEDLHDEDKALSDYVVLTCKRLEECGMVRIYKRRIGDFRTWKFCSTEYGRIASMHYLSHETIEGWLKEMEDVYDEDSILKICFESKELSSLGCREEDEEAIKELCSEMGMKYEVSIGCKLMTLVKAYIKRHPITRFSLVCDAEHVVKNLRRVLMGLCQIFMFQGRHLAASKCCILLKRVERQRERSWNDDNRVEAGLSRVNGMVKVEISLKAKGEYWIFIWDGCSAIYSDLFRQRTGVFIESKSDVLKIEIIARDEWAKVEKEYKVCKDTSVRSLYYDGVHECSQKWSIVGEKQPCAHFSIINAFSDLPRAISEWMLSHDDASKPKVLLTSKKVSRHDLQDGGCLHVSLCYRKELKDASGISVAYLRPDVPTWFAKYILCDFSLQIRFVQVDCRSFRERLQIMNSCIISMSIYTNKRVVIVAPDEADMRNTVQDLSTRMLLREMSRGKCGVKVRSGVPRRGDTGVFVTTFDRALDVHEGFTVIFKGCSDSGRYFPMFEVLRICDSKEVFIYESKDFIEYFNCCILSNGGDGD
ncbi:ski2-like helicase [Encephalitozoon hellem ATCC 50504]|uniref:Activating signal cointegrator 1 complex subunit 3 n=1 Tax=Encephalitozoon hellem TaxID=27973 RepID=A0A9Q9F9Q9_ENCHE|nr:ski2-like helicase [Encephalitozoon hellem ATCC 50504]AFM98607.1 ski2-like helicase [Encephalitozoon hellem ATCC 50504]UTX43551.1 activating signal cointegrator 1 complex subunit 3 [Encephalitozoon hellem]|eukprot:XP_003887588.1 ski2-like helicase [Encephalitozoon hellem ATCC 50504]